MGAILKDGLISVINRVALERSQFLELPRTVFLYEDRFGVRFYIKDWQVKAVPLKAVAKEMEHILITSIQLYFKAVPFPVAALSRNDLRILIGRFVQEHRKGRAKPASNESHQEK